MKRIICFLFGHQPDKTKLDYYNKYWCKWCGEEIYDEGYNG